MRSSLVAGQNRKNIPVLPGFLFVALSHLRKDLPNAKHISGVVQQAINDWVKSSNHEGHEGSLRKSISSRRSGPFIFIGRSVYHSL